MYGIHQNPPVVKRQSGITAHLRSLLFRFPLDHRQNPMGQVAENSTEKDDLFQLNPQANTAD